MLSLNGIPLDDPAGRWHVDAATSLRQPGQIATTMVRLPGRDGAILAGQPTIGPALRRIAMQVHGANYAENQTNAAALYALFGRRSTPHVLREAPPGGEAVEAVCHLSGVTTLDVGDPTLGDTLIVFDLTIPLGVYQSAPVTVALSAGSITLAALAGGSARQPSPSITFTPAATGAIQLRVAADDDPQAWINLAGTATSTAPITVTTRPLAAKQGATSLSAWLDAGPHPLHVPADGKLDVQLVNGTATITSRKAWY